MAEPPRGSNPDVDLARVAEVRAALSALLRLLAAAVARRLAESEDRPPPGPSPIEEAPHRAP